MPMVEQYGAQPPIELLRQLLDQGGFYDRPLFYFKEIEKFNVLCAAAPPGGGRSALTPRFMRHFHIINLPDPSEDAMRSIFEAILREFLTVKHFPESVRKLSGMAVAATVDMYTQITQTLLPIPSKFHYTFNLRDVAKVFQGILMTKP
jgi:dynein heavy chain